MNTDINKTLVYDGSFNGFLTLIYCVYEQRIPVGTIQRRQESQKTLFAEPLFITTNTDKARRVWDALEKKQYLCAKKVYFAFLSERRGVEMLLYRYLRNLFAGSSKSRSEDLAACLSKIESLADAVAGEKKRLEKEIRFRKSVEGAAMAILHPRFNVLPLITRYFSQRYPMGNWMLYDAKRQFGLHFDNGRTQSLNLSLSEIEMLLPRQDASLPEGKTSGFGKLSRTVAANSAA